MFVVCLCVLCERSDFIWSGIVCGGSVVFCYVSKIFGGSTGSRIFFREGQLFFCEGFAFFVIGQVACFISECVEFFS
jgi:hypothetical protein